MKCKNIECEKETINNRKYCSLSCRNIYVNKHIRDYNKNNVINNNKELEYLLNPKKCDNCGNIIPFKKKNNIFCNRSCSVQKNNKKRNCTWGKKISDGLKKYIEVNGKFGSLVQKLKSTGRKRIIYNNICLNCHKYFNKKSKYCDNNCRREYEKNNGDKYQIYKFESSFKFNLKDYIDEFDFTLIEEYGWYSPSNKKNNLKGVSRDHMFSVKEGFEKGIDPKIISHPANCKLMIHNENISKHKKSSITLEELLDRIEYFNRKYKIEG
jgi:hypothetical protein